MARLRCGGGEGGLFDLMVGRVLLSDVVSYAWLLSLLYSLPHLILLLLLLPFFLLLRYHRPTWIFYLKASQKNKFLYNLLGIEIRKQVFHDLKDFLPFLLFFIWVERVNNRVLKMYYDKTTSGVFRGFISFFVAAAAAARACTHISYIKTCV